MRQKKKSLLFMIVLLLLFLGIGYAYLTTTLSINGTTDIDANNWDLYFDNINITNGSVTGAQVISAPEVGNDEVSVSFHVRLKEPGEFFEFTVDAKNDGTIDAMIESITKKLNNVEVTTLPAYLKYDVTYADGVEIENNHLLAHESLETYKVRIEYRNDINPGDLPSNAQNLSLSFGVEYVQSNSNAQSVGHMKYTANIYDSGVGNNIIWEGQALPDGIIVYSNSVDALTALRNATNDENILFYLKHAVKDGFVTKSYLEFVITEEFANANTGVKAGTYAIRGLNTYDETAISTDLCKVDYYNSNTRECTSPYYSSNKAILLEAFGSTYCTETDYNSFSSFNCSLPALKVYTETYGAVGSSDDIWACGVYSNGSSYCELIDFT